MSNQKNEKPQTEKCLWLFYVLKRSHMFFLRNLNRLYYTCLFSHNLLKAVTDTAGEEGFKDGTHTEDYDYIYDVNDFRVQDFEKVLYEVL